MDAVIPLWMTSVAAVVAAVYSIWRNGRRRREKDEQLKRDICSRIDQMENKVMDPNEGLGAINREMHNMQTHCAGVTAGFSAKIEALEKETADIKRRRRK